MKTIGFEPRISKVRLAIKNTLATSTLALAVASPVAVADGASDSVRYFDTIVVTSSKGEQKLGDVAGSIDVITEEQIEKNMVDSVDELFKYTPSVTVGGSGIRGDAPINVRGITGNRVLVTVDGVRQPKNLSFGFLNSSRHFIDVNTLKQVEVVPGPASSLYGSDALGGAVAYTTKDPDDIYKGKGDGFGGSVNARYNTGDDSFSKTIALAGRNGSAEAMAIVTHRTSSEMENTGDVGGIGATREVADPEDNKDLNLLGKLVYNLDASQKIKLTVERVTSDEETDAQSGTLLDTKYFDEKRRSRVSAEYESQHATAVFDSINARLNWQRAETDQLATYVTLGPSSYDSDYDETDVSLELDFSKKIMAGSTEHDLTYGVSVERQEFKQWRNSSSSGIARGMPVSEGKSYAVYLQDQIKLGDVTLVPGVRYDTFEVSPQPDALSPPGAADNEGDQVSFKFGATWDVNERNSLFAQFAQGFKAPDMDQLYESFDRPGAYAGLPAPNLKPESVNSYEVGYRFFGDSADAEIVAFYNDYTDFIENVTLSPNPDPATYPFGVFQNQNLTGVKIRGVEFKTNVDLTDDISVRGGVAYTKGEYKRNGVTAPLNSVSPMHGTLGVAYKAPSRDWGTELSMTASARKKAGDVDGAAPLLSKGYAVFDLTGYYDVSKNLRFNAGVFNMFDKKYWEWENIRDGRSIKPEAARHFKVGLTYEFE